MRAVVLATLVLATRCSEPVSLEGGLKTLRELLQGAIQVEQTTIQPYVSAMYSLHDDANSNASSAMHSVAIEEMLHLTTAANILNAVGGHPCVNCSEWVPAYPQYLKPLNVTVNVAPFSPAQVQAFRRLEEPLWDTKNQTVGTLYSEAGYLMMKLVKTYGEAAVFVGDPNLQVNFSSSRGSARPVFGLDDADSMIKGVLAEGEGGNKTELFDVSPFTGEEELAHYFRFTEIMKDRRYERHDSPFGPPSGDRMGTDWTAVHDFSPNPKAEDYRAFPDVYAKMMEFNACYTLLLARLQAALNGAPESYGPSVAKMHAVSVLAKELVQTPSPLDPSKGLGPPWELIDLATSEYQCTVRALLV